MIDDELNRLRPRDRLGLNREEAAFYIHVAIPTWNRLVCDGVMPQPKKVGNRFLWDRREVGLFFANSPNVGQVVEEAEDGW